MLLLCHGHRLRWILARRRIDREREERHRRQEENRQPHKPEWSTGQCCPKRHEMDKCVACRHDKRRSDKRLKSGDFLVIPHRQHHRMADAAKEPSSLLGAPQDNGRERGALAAAPSLSRREHWARPGKHRVGKHRMSGALRASARTQMKDARPDLTGRALPRSLA